MPKLVTTLKKRLDFAFIRWGLVGTLTNSLDYILFVYLYFLTPSVLLANSVSGLFSYSINYYFHHKWTFKSNQNKTNTGYKYVINILFWWLISTTMINYFIYLDIDPRLSKLIPFFIIIPCNYFILSKFVFKKVKNP
jgi:putative flippase GtrA